MNLKKALIKDLTEDREYLNAGGAISTETKKRGYKLLMEMAVPDVVISGRFSGEKINKKLNGITKGQVLLKEITRNYNTYQSNHAGFKPNQDLFDKLMGANYEYKAILIYTNGSNIPVSKEKIQKIDISVIKDAVISHRITDVYNDDILFDVKLKAALYKEDKNVYDYNSIFIVLVPVKQVKYAPPSNDKHTKSIATENKKS